jgi:hypothetical protein
MRGPDEGADTDAETSAVKTAGSGADQAPRLPGIDDRSTGTTLRPCSTFTAFL